MRKVDSNQGQAVTPMGRLMQKTRVLIDRLYASWYGLRPLPVEEETRLVQEISEAREPTTVTALLVALVSKHRAVAEMAASAIQQIVDASDPVKLAWMDATFRDRSEWRLPQMDPAEVRTVSLGLNGVLGVLSMHTSGFVREAAVHELAASQSEQGLAFLLIRLNDWVTPVREAAQRAVLVRLTPANAPAFVACLPLIFRVGEQGRADHTPLVAAMLELLRRPECREALLVGLRASDRQTQRLAFKVLVEQDDDELIAVLNEGSRADDPMIRLWATQWLRARLTGDTLQSALERGLADPFMSVRREAIYGFVEQLPDVATTYLRRALTDSHPSIREVARFHLRKAGENDFVDFYRVLLSTAGNGLHVAVAGLGETGTPADAHIIQPLVTAPNPRVRRAAIRALGRLDGEGQYNEAVLAALGDDSARVAKAARDVLLTRRHLLSADRLSATYDGARHPHVRRITLSLIAQLTWWDSAPLLMTATGSADADVAAKAMEYLHRWRHNCGRLYIKPTVAQQKKLHETLKLHWDQLDDSIRSDVDSHLAYAGREAGQPQ